MLRAFGQALRFLSLKCFNVGGIPALLRYINVYQSGKLVIQIYKRISDQLSERLQV